MKKLSALLFLSFLFSANRLWAQGAAERSGVYQELTLAVDAKRGVVTGYYENATGMDPATQQPRFNCIFYLYGKKAGDKYAIQSWFPADKNPKQIITGELKFIPADKGQGPPSVQVRLHQEPGGCGMVDPDLAKPEGEQLALDTQGDWSEVRVVSAAKAHFYEYANAPAPKKIYVVRGDALGVLEKSPGWVKAEFQGKTRGWIQETDLFATEPGK